MDNFEHKIQPINRGSISIYRLSISFCRLGWSYDVITYSKMEIKNVNLLNIFKLAYSEVVSGGVLQKTLLLKILQNSQENTCVGVSF